MHSAGSRGQDQSGAGRLTEYDVRLHRGAIADLSMIVRYIRDDLGSPMAADTFLNQAVEAMNSLASMSERNPVMHDLGTDEVTFRWMPVKNFDLIYHVDQTRHRVYVVGIVYARASEDTIRLRTARIIDAMDDSRGVHRGIFYNPSGDSISQESEGECARMVQGMNVRFRVR